MFFSLRVSILCFSSCKYT